LRFLRSTRLTLPQAYQRADGYADLRLAVVSPFVDRRHGTERALAELLERLAGDYGCEIHLYAQHVEDLHLSDRRSAHSTNSGAIFWHKVPSIPGPHLAQFLVWMFLNGFLRWWHTTFSGALYDFVLSPGINCLHPDVVIVHALFHRLKELAREEYEDSGAHAGFFRQVHRRLYYGLLAALERRIYTDPKVTLAAVSKRTAGLLNQYFHRKDVCVIPNGVDTKHFSVAARLTRRAEARQRRGFRDEDFVLLLIGNDWRNKGLRTNLEALSALARLPLRLLVVGSDNVEFFRKLAVQLRVEERCRWEVSSPDVLDFYAAADVYVSPSREDSFGLPVAEAMACGLPVVTSVCAGVADLIHDGVDGFVLQDPHDTEALSQLIKRLQAESELRNKIGEAAASAILEWDWNRNAAALWEFLKDVKTRNHPTG
jgi:glycosyltransferase involved in cell wall biosynthesis